MDLKDIPLLIQAFWKTLPDFDYVHDWGRYLFLVFKNGNTSHPVAWCDPLYNNIRYFPKFLLENNKFAIKTSGYSSSYLISENEMIIQVKCKNIEQYNKLKSMF